MQTLISPHWCPSHVGQEDDKFMLQLRPKVIKLFFIGESIPRLDVALSAATELVVLRHHGISENYDQRGISSMTHAERMARDHAEAWRKFLAPIPSKNKIAVEGLNEPEVWDWGREKPEFVSHYYAELTRLMSLQGVRTVVGNLGVGWPGNGEPAMPPNSPPIWKPFAEMIETAMQLNGFLGLHEYWYINGPQTPWVEGDKKFGGWGWWAGRFRTCPWNVKIIITECGIDAHVLSGKDYFGWHGLPEPRELLYMSQLIDYEYQCIIDGRVVALTPFLHDFYDRKWATYDTRTEQFQRLWLEHARKMERNEYVLPKAWELPKWSSQPWKPSAPYVPPTVPPTIPTEPQKPSVVTKDPIVYDVNGNQQTLKWLEDTYGLKVDKSLRRKNTKNWHITTIRVVRSKTYFVEVLENAGELIQVGRTWLDDNGKAQAPNGWPNGVCPDNVTCPPEAKGSVVIASKKGPGTLQVSYAAGSGDIMTNKNGTNMFWMIDHRYGSDVLRNTAITADGLTFMPRFELIDAEAEVVPTPSPEPVSGKWANVINKWDKIVTKWAATYNVSREIVHTIIILESRGNPDAINNVSGATGLMQIMPKESGFDTRPTQSELLDPNVNIEWGCKILQSNIKRFPQIEVALCAYGGVKDPNNLLGDKAQQYLKAFEQTWREAWPSLTLPITIPVVYQTDRQRLIAVRWWAEESTRKIESKQYDEARRILLTNVIAELYNITGEVNPNA